MIASPSDIADARQAVVEALLEWNDSNTLNRNVVLLPRRWETSAVPALGGDAQEVINEQLVAESDVVIAVFGARLGQATPRALSGTAEEMLRAAEAGKPVHTYFSTAPLPHDVDTTELERLRRFKEELGGLYATYANPTELKSRVWMAIEHDIAQLHGAIDPAATAPSGAVDFLVQPAGERVPKTDSKGRLRHETKRWVEITNRGDVDAENVMVEPVEGMHFWVSWNGPTTIHRGQMRKAPVDFSMATARAAIVVRWTEKGEERSREFDID